MVASAKFSGVAKLAMVVLAVTLMAVAQMSCTEAAISCSSVVQTLSPCMDYLQGKAGAPSGRCCAGVKSLYSQTQSSHGDRVTTCGCLKSQAQAMGSSISSSNAADVAGKCGVNLGYPVSSSVDCSSLQLGFLKYMGVGLL